MHHFAVLHTEVLPTE